jgi:WD40 repeat protein
MPYRGLASFQPGDAEWFFGREALTKTLVDRITRPEPGRSGLQLVVGPSGAGKSSLLRAGLVAALNDDTSSDRESKPLCLLFTPGTDPMESLAVCLATRSGASPEVESDPAVPVPGTLGPDRPVVLVIDQFEEVFTACPDEDERLEFIAAIGTLAGRPDADPPRARVVLGIRADFYAQLLDHPDLVRAAQDAQLVVGPMSESELRRAIEAPAQKARATVESGLVELFLRDLVPGRSDPEATYEAGALPLLAHALLATWQRGHGRELTVAGYTETGGIRGAVAQTAEQVYGQLTDTQRAVTRRLFVRLVNVTDDAADTRRRLPWVELERDETINEVIDLFVDNRLITADTETIEISHEALIKAWPRLRSWLDADRADLLVGQQVAEAAGRWERERRDPSALYRGVRLAEARDWAARRSDFDLAPLAREFIRTSVRQERRRIRRLYQSVAALTALLLIAVTAGTVALQQRADATRQRNAAISRLVATRADRVRDKDVALAAQLSLAAYRIAPTAEALSSLLDTSATHTATRLLGGPGVMQAVALSPDKRTLAAGGLDRTVRLWDISDPYRPNSLGAPLTGATDTVFAVAFSPDGRTLAAGGGDKVVHLWDVRDVHRPVPLTEPLTGPTALIYSMSFSPDGRTLAAGSGDFAVHRWDVTNRSRPTPLGPPLTGAGSYIQSIAYSPDGQVLAAGSDDKTVRLWNLRDPDHPSMLAPPLTGPTRRVYTVAFSPDGRTLAAGAADSQVYLWDLADPARPVPVGEPISATSGWVNSVAFSPDGATIALASSSSALRLWDVKTRQFTATLPHPGPVTGVVFHSSTTIVTSAADGVARIWHLPGPVLTGHSDIVNGIAFSPDGQTIAIGSGETQLWSVGERRLSQQFLTNKARFSSAIAYTPDGATLAVGSRDGTVQLWNVNDPTTATPVGPPIAAHELVVESLAFSPDGHTLATASDDNTVRLWDVTQQSTPQPLATLEGFTSYVFSVAFSPDRRSLAAGSIDRTVRVWDVTDPHRPTLRGQPVTGPDHYVLAVAFSPDGTTLAIGSADKTIRLIDLTNPDRPELLGPPLGGPTNYVYSLAFSRDGKTLAAANTDETLWLWDVANRRQPKAIATLTTPTGPVYTVAFHPDGHTLAAGGGGKTVWLWETDPDRVIAQICASAGDAITPAEWHQYVSGLAYQTPCRRT